ncbi:MAG TPA: hypothetical protein VFS40_07780 [Gemmatimonadales bacterium]|nr:hypothetical protein [Gemmatimonadales bacterium]
MSACTTDAATTARAALAALAALGALLGLAGCRPSEPATRAASGELHATLRGAARGTIDAAVEGAWCPGPRWLQLVALAGDTGFAVALFPVAGPQPGTYPVRRAGAGGTAATATAADSARTDSARRDSTPRDSTPRHAGPAGAPPVATVGLRWLDKARILGFQGDSGAVVLERGADGRLGGRIRARLRLLTGDSVAHVDATFRGVELRTGGPLCRTDSGGRPPRGAGPAELD